MQQIQRDAVQTVRESVLHIYGPLLLDELCDVNYVSRDGLLQIRGLLPKPQAETKIAMRRFSIENCSVLTLMQFK